jgi:hypothetical protein
MEESMDLRPIQKRRRENANDVRPRFTKIARRWAATTGMKGDPPSIRGPLAERSIAGASGRALVNVVRPVCGNLAIAKTIGPRCHLKNTMVPEKRETSLIR